MSRPIRAAPRTPLSTPATTPVWSAGQVSDASVPALVAVGENVRLTTPSRPSRKVLVLTVVCCVDRCSAREYQTAYVGSLDDCLIIVTTVVLVVT